MKVFFTVCITVFALQCSVALAQTAKDPHAGHMAMDAKSPAQSQEKIYKATGVVKKIDPAKGSVTFAHGPVAELKWPAMTMGFAVKDKALLEKLAVGKKVEFEFVEQGKSYVVTAVK